MDWLTELPALTAAHGDDNEAIAAAINATVEKVPKPIEFTDLILWGSNGASELQPSRIARCQLAAQLKPPYEKIGYPAQGAAIASVGLFSAAVPSFSWFEPKQQKLIGFLVSAGVFSAEEIAELVNAYGYTTRKKYPPINDHDVAAARRAVR